LPEEEDVQTKTVYDAA